MNITQSFVSERDRALLGGDYSTYHAQATRKLHALRKRLGNATLRGRKYTPKAPVTAENVAQNAEWVQLLLATSERAWASAMAMKSAQSPENTQKPVPGSTKRQIVSRYRRATLSARNLVEVLEDEQNSKATNIDILEAKAYLALLEGGLDFEKHRWSSCIQHYAVTRLVYIALGATAKSDIYKDLLDDTVDPSIRYAAYQSKLPRTKAVADITIENFPAGETKTRSEIEKLSPEAFQTTTEKAAVQSDRPTNLPSVIEWRSRRVQIEDASISQALGIAEDKEKSLSATFDSSSKGDISSSDLAAAYDDVIDARQDAVDATKSAIDELRGEGVDQGDSRIQSLQITRTALSYAVIEWRIGRNRVLCGRDDGLLFEPEQRKQNSKPRKDGKSREVKEESAGRQLARLRERTALYDAILQSLDTVKELPGVIADTAFVGEIDGKKAYFRALKCLAIGRSHAINGKVPEALALYSRAGDLAKQSSSLLKTPSPSRSGPSKLDLTADQQKAVLSHLTSLVLQYRALADLSSLNNKTPVSKEKVFIPPLLERLHLNQYEENVDLTNLVNYPPKLQPVPVKPLFFDLAWNYIQYPGQEAAQSVTAPSTAAEPPTTTTQAEQQEEKPTKRGWFGFGR